MHRSEHADDEIVCISTPNINGVTTKKSEKRYRKQIEDDEGNQKQPV